MAGEPRTAEDEIMALLSGDNPKARKHREQAPGPSGMGYSYWTCIPVRDVVESGARAALLVEAAAPASSAGLDGLRAAILVELASSIPGTCDWGGCDNNALLARHDPKSGWLPVCQWHAGDASAADLAPITAVAFEDAWERAALATSTEEPRA